MSDDDDLVCECLADPDWAAEEIRELRSLARRVHAECGPVVVSVDDFDRSHSFEVCQSCNENDCNRDINHKPDCLWLAAEACIKKSGVT